MIQFTERGLIKDGIEQPLYSGAIHYWRIEKKYWKKILYKICELGFKIIETYIPWSVHEYAEGCYDFGGQNEQKSLDGFLQLCEEMGLLVIVRPGPHINAEMTGFGYPEWILADREIQAVNSLGTTVLYPYVAKQFPIPSYASEKLYSKTKAYFRKLEPILKKHIGNKGCIAAIQADNETCNFFRDRPYIMDYSISSIQLYHTMLEEKYGHITVLNKIYHKSYTDWMDIKPPTGFRGRTKEDLPYYFDWVEYKEYQILFSLKKIVGILMEMNLGIPVFHNCAYQNYTPISLQRDEQIPGLEVAGIDAYPEPDDALMLKERIRYLAGSSRLPYVPEFGSGSWFDRECLLTAKQEEFGYLYAFMNGLKAINFYMLVERDRWTGCPITADGRIREDYFTMFQNMIKMLSKEKIYQYSRTPRILVMKSYDMGRLKALYSRMDLNSLSSNCFIKGPEVPFELLAPIEKLPVAVDTLNSPYAFEEWIHKITVQLDNHQIEYNYSDKYLTVEKWDQYDIIIASSYEFMEEKDQKNLLDFAKKENKKLLLGPKLPYLNRSFTPCTVLKDAVEKYESKSVFISDGILISDEILSISQDYDCINKQIELSVHQSEDNKRQLLYAANKSGEQINTRILFQSRYTFSAIWNAAGIQSGMELIVEAKPLSIQIWKIEKGEAYD